MCTMKCKSMIITVAMMLLAGWPADAQHCHRNHWRRGNRVVSVVPYHVPVTRVKVETSHVSNRFSQKERLAMVVAYLDAHAYMTVNQYARMTQLSKLAAEAELDAFAMDKKNNIAVIDNGRKRTYEKNGKS